MLPENAIEVKNVSKKFKIYYDKGTTLKEKVLFEKRRKYENRIVLKDISFYVKQGEAIGLIGHNGCGKSTTLKLLTRIMYPDSGSIEIKGRVSSLIELGAGFHPDMTGRENIYINAAIFGLTRKEIDARLQDIIDFSELHEFIDNPVRTYSSGMYMRLAFSVAINVDAEVLLIDEILGVGDANFQAKCFNKLKEIKANGTTIVIVSHSLNQIEQICERSLWIHDGRIEEEGIPKEVHEKYLDFILGRRSISLEKVDVVRKENYMKYEYYDHVISLGYSCQVAEQLRRLGLSTASFPFDWLFTRKIEKLIQALSDDFSDWLLEENLVEEPSETNHLRVIDLKYAAEHQHIFPKGSTIKESYANIKRIVDRRVSRLLSLRGKKLLFIRVCDELNGIGQLEQVLRDKFGDNVQLMVLIQTQNTEIKKITTDLQYTQVYEIYRENNEMCDKDSWKGYSPHYDVIFQNIRVNTFYAYLQNDEFFCNFGRCEVERSGMKFRWTKESSKIDLRKFIGCKCKIRVATPVPMRVFIYDSNRNSINEMNITEWESFEFYVAYETRFLIIEPEFLWTPREKFGYNDDRKLGVRLEEIRLERIENNN